MFLVQYISHSSSFPPAQCSMANLDKFLSKHPKLDHPGSEVLTARQSIINLQPVQPVKVVCLGYRK